VIRKDGHYDRIYQRAYVPFEIEELKDCDQDFLNLYIADAMQFQSFDDYSTTNTDRKS
jgi:hypothetical protein